METDGGPHWSTITAIKCWDCGKWFDITSGQKQNNLVSSCPLFQKPLKYRVDGQNTITVYQKD